MTTFHILGVDLQEPPIIQRKSVRRIEGIVGKYGSNILLLLFILAKVDGNDFIIKVGIDSFELFEQD